MPILRTIAVLALGLGALARAQEPAVGAAALPRLLGTHCADCHGGDEPDAGLDLSAPAPEAAAEFDRLGRIRRRVRALEMPPPDLGLLPEADRGALLAALDDEILRRDEALEHGPGRVTVRRLSRTEYRNAVRDLFGVPCDAADAFPADDLGYGFDNIGDARSTSLLHLEKFLAAAEEVARRTLDVVDPDHPDVQRVQAEFMTCSYEIDASGDHVCLFKRGHLRHRVRVPRAGRYRLRVRAWEDPGGDEHARCVVSVDGADLADLEVAARRGEPVVLELEADLPEAFELRLEFRNDFFDANAADRDLRDRNLRLDWAEIEGPLDRRPPSAGQAWILAKDPGRGTVATRAKAVLAEMVRRIWRRPAKTAELRRLGGLVAARTEEGASFREALRTALEALLVSPNFLFRLEPGGKAGRGAEGLELGDHELASRLSFFLWASVPDEALLDAADAGELGEGAKLRAAAERMLADSRSDAIARNFAAQWLELRNLADFEPDPERFPALDAELKASMVRETELFVLDLLRRGRPVSELLSADWSFLDARLARHYGVPGVTGDEHRRVEFSDPRRGGLLGQAAILAVTSNPTRTSVVKRGKWILDNVLDAPPPAPPPGVDNLGDEKAIGSAATLRARMEAHRSDPACASCHVRMDALGFALEHFDAVGRLRERDGDAAVDARGRLPDGREIDGAAALKRLLASDPALPVAIARTLFVYAVGRPSSGADEVRLERRVAALGPDPSLHALILAVVESEAFRRRSAER
ncbi:MAG: DUF1592 domain-containing protein [Planctomycetota bacterium]